MALVVTIIKKSVTEMQDKLWCIKLNMVLTDDAIEVINEDYSLLYRTGDSIAAKEARWVEIIQEDIDKYKNEQNIFDAGALNTVVTNVEAALEV